MLLDDMSRAPDRERSAVPDVDRLQIEMQHVSVCFAHGLDEEVVLRDINIRVSQGTLVAVSGQHGAGRATFMKCLGRVINPNSGLMYVPSHIRTLHVSQEPVLLNLSLTENMTFGCLHPLHASMERLQHILANLQMPQAMAILQCEIRREAGKSASRRRLASRSTSKRGWEVATPSRQLHKAQQLKNNGVIRPALSFEHKLGGGTENDSEDSDTGFGSDSEEEDDFELEEGTDTSWQEQLTYTERAKLHLARAFVVNPEILVLDRPLHHYHSSMASHILSALRTYVEQRGFCVPCLKDHHRRPRTVFFSPENREQAGLADFIWDLSVNKDGEHIVTQERGTGEQRAASMRQLLSAADDCGVRDGRRGRPPANGAVDVPPAAVLSHDSSPAGFGRDTQDGREPTLCGFSSLGRDCTTTSLLRHEEIFGSRAASPVKCSVRFGAFATGPRSPRIVHR